MVKYKMIVFANCHGEKYINTFKKNSNINDIFDIEYLLSYEMLDNFQHLKNKFETADVLIINRIKSYSEFTVSNLKSLMKPGSKLIVIPFIRFNGYWLPEEYKKMKNFNTKSVEDFPNINIDDVNSYLSEQDNEEKITHHFEEALEKLKLIEKESDIKFFDWFCDNHLKYPMFRDYKHPTDNFISYTGNELMKLIKSYFSEVEISFKLELKQNTYEHGHYKPIKDYVKKILNIEYDIDKVFVCSRYHYITTILNHEESDIFIDNLDTMKEKLIPDPNI